jgi:hypothetical protein
MPPHAALGSMSFSIPPDLESYLQEIDSFIEAKIAPLQASNDNERFFDHRREHARVVQTLLPAHLPPDIFNRPTGTITAFRGTIGKSF